MLDQIKVKHNVEEEEEKIKKEKELLNGIYEQELIKEKARIKVKNTIQQIIAEETGNSVVLDNRDENVSREEEVRGFSNRH